MFTIQPTYYLSQAAQAKDYKTFAQAWINYWKTTQLQSLFIVDKLVVDYQKSCQNFYQTIFQVKA